jgi:hypothetical protein
MERDTITTGAYVLAIVMGIGYAAAAIIGWIADVTDGDGSDLAFWVVLLLGGAALVLAGLFATPRWSTASAVLVSLGAIVGALPLVWSIIVPILALVLVALAILASRRSAATA